VGIGTSSPNLFSWSGYEKVVSLIATKTNGYGVLEVAGNDVSGSGGAIVALGSGTTCYSEIRSEKVGTNGGNLQVRTRPDGGALTLRMVVDDQGRVGIGDSSPSYPLDVAGKIGINDTQILYLPNQTDFTGTLILGTGGASLSHSGGTDYGRYNTVFGIGSMNANTTGYMNTAGGFQALYSNQSGYCNTADGFQALFTNAEDQNTAVGYQALYYNSTGEANTAIGSGAMVGNSTGRYNTAGGYQALYFSNGSQNTASGYKALYSNTSGNNNTAAGYNANYWNEAGSNNTIIGCEAGKGSSAHTKSGNVFIGYQAGYNETGGDMLYIENTNSSSPLIWGDFADDIIVINGNSASNGSRRTFFVNGSAGGTGQWWNDSDGRLKRNVETIPAALEKVMKLHGVNFEWKETENREPGVQMGFIAQEAEAVIPEVVDATDGRYSMQYAPITALLVEAVKEQQKIIQEQQKRIEALEEKW
jgi:hypothetical protein